MSERRFQYEADVKQDPLNYDSWFDYIRLEEAAGQPDRVRSLPRCIQAPALLHKGIYCRLIHRCRDSSAAKQLTHDLQVREVYERAIANVPPAPEKRYWQRYIYLWIRYALWEELEAEDAERTRQVYRACLNLIPHSVFTFAKVSLPGSPSEHRADRSRVFCSQCGCFRRSFHA